MEHDLRTFAAYLASTLSDLASSSILRHDRVITDQPTKTEPHFPRPPMPVPLLGLMTTAGENWMLGDWLHRHATLFVKLVVVDRAFGADHALTRSLCAAYVNTFVIQQKEDDPGDRGQAVRMLAMQVLGNPVGSWILLVHPDEWYLMDPRQVAEHVEAIDPRANVVVWQPEWMMPTREEWYRITRDPEKFYVSSEGRQWSPTGGKPHTPSAASAEFHVLNELRTADGNYRMCEERLFRWCQGCEWVPASRFPNGSSTASTIGMTPLTFPKKRTFGPMGQSYQECINQEHSAMWYLHFKIHRFDRQFAARLNGSSVRRHDAKGKLFENSGWQTGLEWPGGVDDYYQQPARKVGRHHFLKPQYMTVEDLVQRDCGKVGQLVEYKAINGSEGPFPFPIVWSKSASKTLQRTHFSHNGTPFAAPSSPLLGRNVQGTKLVRFPGCTVPLKHGARFGDV